MLWKKHIHNNFYKWNNYAQIVVTSKQKRLTKSMKNIKNETTIFSILICFSVTHDQSPILNCEEDRYSNMLNSLKIRKRKH